MVDNAARQTLALAGREIDYTVRRSPRARRIGLRISPTRGLEVVLPARGRAPDIPALLRDKADWIVAALDRVAARTSPPPAPLEEGAILPYRGADYRLVIVAQPHSRPAVARDELARTITITLPDADASSRDLLERWYRREARAIIGARATAHAMTLGVTFTRLTIRDGRSRWGSCSSTGSLNFSWRLVLAPPTVLDYVVIHELAHRRELNHSPRFWAIVAAHCPEYRARQRWLKDEGPRLMTLLRDAPE